MNTPQAAFLALQDASEKAKTMADALKDSMESDRILGPMLEELKELQDTVAAEKKRWKSDNEAQLKKLAELRQAKKEAKLAFDETWEVALRRGDAVPPLVDKRGQEYEVSTQARVSKQKDVKKADEAADPLQEEADAVGRRKGLKKLDGIKRVTE